MSMKEQKKKVFYSTPKGKLFYNRHVINFDPYNPSPSLVAILEDTITPSSNYITKSLRGKKFSEISLEQSAYIGYEARMGTDDSRILARLKYFIELAKDNTITKDEIEQLLYDEEVGIKITKLNVECNNIVEKPKINPFG